MGDRIAVLNDGVLQQVGTPAASSTTSPATLFVAGFIGSPAMNLAPARVAWSVGGAHVEFGGIRLRVDDEAFSRPGPA